MNRPVLQNRWQIERRAGGAALVYFGLRNPPRHLDQYIPVSLRLEAMLTALDGHHTPDRIRAEFPDCAGELGDLVTRGIVVDLSERRWDKTAETAQTCVRCINNDLVLPGLEFDDRGVCAFCQCYEKAPTARRPSPACVSEEALLDAARANRASRFDVMVLYTGGKDSSYLLWYLAHKLGLRVLAATWNMPYMNEESLANMRRAKKRLPTVEFIDWTPPWQVVKSAMRNQFHKVGAPCLCPTVAIVHFYPEAVRLQIPYFMMGTEDAQMSVMDHVFPFPSPPQDEQEPVDQALLSRKITLGMLRSMMRPFIPGKALTWHEESPRFQSGVRLGCESLYGELAEVLARCEQQPDSPLPLIKKLNTGANYGTWVSAYELIQRELDWRLPAGQKSLLHTSCRIEPVKDYVQYVRFKNMRTVFFPQSIVEMSASVYFGLLDREEALRQAADLGYFGHHNVRADLLKDLDITDPEIDSSDDELFHCLRCSHC